MVNIIKDYMINAIEHKGSWMTNEDLGLNTDGDKYRFKEVNTRIAAEFCTDICNDISIKFAEYAVKNCKEAKNGKFLIKEEDFKSPIIITGPELLKKFIKEWKKNI